MTHPLARHGRLVRFEHHPRDGCWQGRLTPQDGGDARVAVAIGPLSAWRPEEQALVAGLAGALEAPVRLAADGLDSPGMLIIDDRPAGIFDTCLESIGELHHILSVLLITLKMTYTERVSTLKLGVPGETA
jgi:hypothetical protein